MLRPTIRRINWLLAILLTAVVVLTSVLVTTNSRLHRVEAQVAGGIQVAGSIIVLGAGPHSIGGMPNPAAQLMLTGPFTGVNDAVAFFINSTITLPPGGSSFHVELQPRIVRAASGNHPSISGLLVDSPIITGGAATVTDAITLVVGAAPVGVGTINRTARFGVGSVEFQGVGGHSFGGVGDETAQLYLRGSLAGGNQGLIVATTFNPVANASSYGVGTGITINKAASGTHANFDGAFFQPPVVGAGAAQLTNASTVKITGAPTGATNNYALWIAGGPTRIQGLGSFTSEDKYITVDTNGNLHVSAIGPGR